MNEISDYVAYEIPRLALYNAGFEYDSKLNWVDIEKQTLVLGEDSHFYVEEIKPSEWGDLHLGFHKSRLIKWMPVQITLF